MMDCLFLRIYFKTAEFVAEVFQQHWISRPAAIPHTPTSSPNTFLNPSTAAHRPTRPTYPLSFQSSPKVTLEAAFLYPSLSYTHLHSPFIIHNHPTILRHLPSPSSFRPRHSPPHTRPFLSSSLLFFHYVAQSRGQIHVVVNFRRPFNLPQSQHKWCAQLVAGKTFLHT